ncbi:MAG: hypothetical protein JRJ84_01910 [Deltaproteobacteria bacterium]|nr:hypothetical protein [Deltaproteobacteria bacterium]
MMDWWLGGSLGPGGELVWTSPEWVVVLAAAAALVALGLAWIGERWWVARLGEALAWALALAALVVALARPVWLEEEGRLEPGRVAVLIDSSRSMAILEEGTPRVELGAAIADRLDGEDVDLYHFGHDLGVGRPSAAEEPGTDLEGALDALRERVAGERLAGVVVITDGLDRGLLRRRFQEEGPTASALDLPGPLTVYQAGSAGDVRDLAVRKVDTGGFAFLRSPFLIRARIEGVGFGGRTISAALQRDGLPVTEERVRLDAEGMGEVEFLVQPDQVGRFNYAVTVPTYQDDAVPANNTMPIVVSVVRDRIRVLQVVGHPSWDVKFLRRFLKGDPSVDLVSFFILRTQRDMDGSYHQDELSLIEFPHERLFSSDLHDFDLVVFQNFDHQPYFRYDSHQLLRNIRRYVEEDGHGLVMIGGDRSFDLGAYGGTPLEGILPLRLGVPGEAADPAPFRPLLTEEGARHPITRLANDPVENAAWWDRLQPMDGTNLTLGATDDATVLLAHPTRTVVDGSPLPILAVREVGRGRTMALTVDASWRWSFSEAAQGRGNQAYLRFWKNAFRWLMDDPTAARVTVETPRENYAVHDVVQLVIRVRDPGFAPLPGASARAEVTVGGHTTTLKGRTGADGEVVLELPAEHRGAHRVKVVVTDLDIEVGVAETVYAVTTRDPEVDEVAPDGVFLQWLAARVDGRYYGPGEFGPILRDPEAGRTVWDRRETPLSRAPALALWMGLWAGLAWIMRRRSGMR